MNVTFDGKSHVFDRKVKAGDLLKQLHCNPETHLVAVNGELVTHDHVIQVNDEVRIIRVVSGG